MSNQSIPTINHYVALIRIKSFDDSPAFVEKIAQKIINYLDLKVVKSDSNLFYPQGVTLAYILSESHLLIHSWPEFGTIHLDLVTCGYHSVKEFEDALKSAFLNNADSIMIKSVEFDKNKTTPLVRLQEKNILESIKRKVAVCTLSGGLDSAVAAAVMAEAGFELHFIFFDWGQKTYKKELDCAKALARHYQANLEVTDIPFLKTLPGISLTQKETLTTEINEYVPNRNAIMESQAIAYAEYLKAGAVCVGSTGGDRICPDNSPRFIDAMQYLIDEGTLLKPSVKIIAPLISTDKTGTIQLGLKLGVPFKLTWSCHNNVEIACGHCSNCRERIVAFGKNKFKDPIGYEPQV